MNLSLIRYAHGADSTGGLIFINGQFFGYTCEDEFRAEKVAGETRIPAGRYEIKLRNEGGMTKKYAAKYAFHRGMLHLQDVPGFEYIYIHTGNTADHTEGCVLVGYSAGTRTGDHTISRSRDAYADLYQFVLLALAEGEQIFIDVQNMEMEAA